MKTQTGYASFNGLRIITRFTEPRIPRDRPSSRCTGAATPSPRVLAGCCRRSPAAGARLRPALACDRQVVALEQQGYGHTADIPGRPFTFEQSADDTAALLEHLRIRQTDLFDFSNGGTLRCRSRSGVRALCAGWWRSRASSGATAPIPGSGTPCPRPAREHPAELQQACFAVAPLSRNLRMMHDQAAPRMPGLQDIPAAIHGIAVSVLVPAGYLARRARGSGPDQPVERHSSASCSISIAPDWSRSLRAAFSRRPETR